jgi:calcineurin-like phosphoesterase
MNVWSSATSWQPGAHHPEAGPSPRLQKYDVDYCIANGKMRLAASGSLRRSATRCSTRVDCLTSGNHIWDKKEILGVIDLIPQLLRPLNYPERQPGRGSHVGKGKRSGVPVATLNLSGRVFMNGAMDDPFKLGMAEVERLRQDAKVIIVAAGNTGESGHGLPDGRVSAVVGTHPCPPVTTSSGNRHDLGGGLTR